MTCQSAPNIVLIMADQLSPLSWAPTAIPLVKTPAIDALAERGTSFDSAYTNSPLVRPARFSFMSGQLITRIAATTMPPSFPARSRPSPIICAAWAITRRCAEKCISSGPISCMASTSA